jgi:hypothetical protein
MKPWELLGEHSTPDGTQLDTIKCEQRRQVRRSSVEICY